MHIFSNMFAILIYFMYLEYFQIFIRQPGRREAGQLGKKFESGPGWAERVTLTSNVRLPYASNAVACARILPAYAAILIAYASAC